MKKIVGIVLNRAEAEQASLVCNKSFALTSDGWFHAVPLGEYPGLLRKPDGTVQQVVQVIDAAACEEIVQAFNKEAGVMSFPGLLVDLEHQADTGAMLSDTKAAAWIKDVEKRADGIWCKFELTKLGKELIEGGVYRYQSPTLDVVALDGDRVQPVRIAKSTLTNTPNFRRGLRPLTNKEQGPDAAGQPKEKTNMDYKAMLLKLLAANGQEVPAEASDESIGQMCDKCMTEIANKAKTAEAEAYAEANKGKIANKTTFVAAYLKNPDAAKMMVDAVVLPATPAAPGVTLNKSGTQPATPAAPVAGQVDNKAHERHALIAKVSVEHGLSGDAAVAKAKEIKPDLFN